MINFNDEIVNLQQTKQLSIVEGNLKRDRRFAIIKKHLRPLFTLNESGLIN